MPKIIGDTLADHRALTRSRLFHALGELLAEQPFDSITMSQIAERADVGRTAVYNHFADKEVLLLAYMREVTTEFTQALSQALDGEPDPIERLRVYLRSHLEMTSRYHLVSGVSLRKQMSPANSEHLSDHAGMIGRVLLTILEDAMNQGAIPRQNALALVSLVHSSLAGQRLPRDPREREASLGLVEVFILRALGVDPARIPASSAAGTADAAPEGEDGEPHPLRSGGDRDAAFARCPAHR
ncbi:TetR/AcrR family transcriptional regulator [Actinomyces sp. B33]|uniref:TetR/AcrR family transcriptional regulator n=1 Tax=Actinomyces sp. B33 TaxID=2942131 RepID=UPI00234265C3|nr:TetR/AcrR family transcriptional regulator [Actinomyces sp. B33]MDC4233450.1 TetR/AcrR family transcriptional regulator [Actinomyces sp. B33]